MKNLVLTIIALIGLYTLLRNNVGRLPDQIIWISNPNLFYKLFIPLLMVTSSVAALIKKDKTNIFLLACCAMLADALFRLSDGINTLYGHLLYKPLSPPSIPPGAVLVMKNLWPSHIMGAIEILLLFFTFNYLIRNIKIEINYE